jgi:hypothetical protein
LGGSDTEMDGLAMFRSIGKGSMMRSVGRSTKVGPGRPYHAMRYAVRMAATMVDGCFDDGRIAVLVWGLNKATASNS